MYKLIASLFAATVIAAPSFSQVGINSSGSAPHASAMLDVSSSSAGMLAPRMTTAQRDAIAAPALGLLIFNTTTNCLNVFVSGWQQMCGDCGFDNPIPTVSGPICAGDQLYFNADYVPDAVYNWTGPNGFTSSDQSPVIYGAQTTDSGTYYVSATRNGCTSSPLAVVATVYEVPAMPTAGNNGPLCEGGTLELTAETIPGVSYYWYGPNGLNTSTQNPVRTDVQLADAGDYYVYTSNGACSSPTASTNVQIIEVPQAMFSPFTGASGTPVTFTPTVSGAVYSWTFESGSPSSSTDESPSVIWSSPGVYNVSLAVTVGGVCFGSFSIGVTIMSSPVSQQFNYTGSSQSFVVPGGVSSVHIEAWGAQGGTHNSNYGGLGGYSSGNLSVTPGQTLYIYVGESPTSPYQGGFNGGGDGVNGSGMGATGGGGGTDVRVGGTSYSDRVIVGGGGGGGGTPWWTVYGGAGGGLTGGFGFSDNGTFRNGFGGTQTQGGAQQTGYPGSGSTDGIFGEGGRGSYNNNLSCGGGGGWYGGGGGEAGAGGGGSGYVGGVTSGVTLSGFQTGHGKVVITY